jgi:hypothetical protein
MSETAPNPEPGVAKTQLRAMPRNAFGVESAEELRFVQFTYPKGVPRHSPELARSDYSGFRGLVWV